MRFELPMFLQTCACFSKRRREKFNRECRALILKGYGELFIRDEERRPHSRTISLAKPDAPERQSNAPKRTAREYRHAHTGGTDFHRRSPDFRGESSSGNAAPYGRPDHGP